MNGPALAGFFFGGDALDFNEDRLIAELTRDEGLRNKPYKDTVGKLTIGVGRNLDDVGLSDQECVYLLHNDIVRSVADLDNNLDWWRDMSDTRQRALINMCFNLGWPRLSGFRNMLAALKASDYDKAASEALDSRWAQQVGSRSERIAEMYRQG